MRISTIKPNKFNWMTKFKRLEIKFNRLNFNRSLFQIFRKSKAPLKSHRPKFHKPKLMTVFWNKKLER